MRVSVFGWTAVVGVPQAVLCGLVLVLVLAGATASATTTAPFDAYNADWTGTSELRQLADADGRTVLFASGADAPPGATTQILLGAPANASEARVARTERFVRTGGTLVVTDEAETDANALLSGVGAAARIRSGPVRDPRNFEGSPLLPTATVTAPDRAGGAESLALNNAGVVAPNGALVLARTAEFSYVDRNADGTLGANESLGSRPVVTTERVGDGRVVVVSDSSLFINGMLDRADNRAFATALLADADSAVLGYPGAARLPALANALLTLRRTPLLQAGCLALALLGLFAVGRAADRREPTDGTGPETRSAERRTPGVVDLLADDRPSADRQRLTRVARAWLEMHEGERDDDE